MSIVGVIIFIIVFGGGGMILYYKHSGHIEMLDNDTKESIKAIKEIHANKKTS